MFAVNLRRLYCVCDKVIVRNLRSRRSTPGQNPGLDQRLQAFREEGLQVVDDDAEEFVEQSESDFYNVGEEFLYNEHLNETLIGKHELRHHIVKDKYFKENMPNLLTWSEKEQIRYLATTSPNEWTPEKIAESFPVTTHIVKKLLRYPWKPATEQRIARHDASAMRNWRELKEGTLDIPEELRQHFLKFSNRTIPPINKKSIKIDITQQKIGEFEKIIQKCAAKENSTQNEENVADDNTTDSDINRNHNNVKRDQKRITLDELTSKIKKRLENNNAIDMPDQIMVNTISSNIHESTEDKVSNEIELCNSSEDELTEYKPIEKKIEPVLNYPERIRIPKKAYKKGATYKVNDCYYDDDGKFLYRVIGMSN